MRISTAVLAVVLCAGTTMAGAQDYRAEIMAEVIDPCYLEILRSHGGPPPGISEREFLEVTKLAMPTSTTKRIVDIVQRMVTGRNREFRTLWYKIMLNKCVNGRSKGLE